MDAAEIRTYEDFWPYYVSQHLHPATRLVHAVGTTAGVVCGAAALALRKPRLLALAPVLGYGPAWVSHFTIEKNRPATFGHPLWSIRADFRMLSRMVRRSMADDVASLHRSLEERGSPLPSHRDIAA